MKNFSFMLFLLFTMGISNPMLAQNPEDMDRGNIIEFLEAKVDLSDEQVAELENIIAQYEVDLAALEEQDFENFMDRFKAYADLKMNFWQQIKSVLTEEQLAELGMRAGDRDDHNDDDDNDGDWTNNPCHRDSLDLEGLRAALDAYRTETIEPAMLELRAGLDEAISTEDQVRIDELRTAIADFKAQMQALKEEARQEDADREAIRARMMELKQGMKENFEALKELLERYREDIKAAFESISEEREEWAVAMQAIRVDYLGEECANRYRHGRRGHEGRGGRGHHRGERRHAERGHHRGERGHHGKRGKKAAHFLLLDTSGERLSDNPTELPAHTLAVSPNPARDFTTLTYKLVEDARIIILLQDNKGNILKRLVDAQTTVGTYTLDVDLSRYKTGSYYFSLSDGVQLISQPTIITKE